MKRLAERRLSEANEAASSVIRRGAVQPASGRAKLEQDVLAGKQMRPRLRLEQLPRRAGAQVLPGLPLKVVIAGMSNTEIEV